MKNYNPNIMCNKTRIIKVKMIAGLGNIGKEYQNTRHNAGQWLVSKIAQSENESFNMNSKLSSRIAKINISSNNMLLVLPNTFMNSSGLAIKNVANFYKICPQEILVAHDELDIDAGAIRLKKSGGHGGHNGLRNIDQHLGTNDYLRLRIGIGHPGDKSKVLNYVLSNPSIRDKIQIDAAINDAIYSLNDIVEYQLTSVMQRLHTRKEEI